MNIKTRKNLFLILLPLISIIAIGSSLIINRRQPPRIENSDVKLESDPKQEISGIPKIVTVAPQSAYEKQYFSYTIKVTDSDTEMGDIEVRLKEAPNWMKLKDGFELYGVPVIVGDDSQKVVVEVSDGTSTIEQVFYLIIHREDELETE